MKRIVLGVVAALSLITVAACGGGSSLPSTECTAYINCAKKVTPTTAATLETTYGPSGSCGASTATADACNSGCTAGLNGLKTSFPDAGC